MRGFLAVGCIVASCVLALTIAAPRLMPDGWQIVPVIDSVLPWLGWLIPVLLIIALLSRSMAALVVLLVPALAWGLVFGGYLLPRGGDGKDLRVATFNVGTGGAADSTKKLAEAAPDVVALQELGAEAWRQASGVMNGEYRHVTRKGTVGLWSRWPLRDVRGIDLGMGWDRALRATVRSPHGDVTVLVVHAASVRPGRTYERDRSLQQAGQVVAQEEGEQLVLLGDLNTSTFDPRMRDLIPPLHDAQLDGGSMFGFTWPSRFPVTRPDQILLKGLTATDATVERMPGSDHYAALADLTFSA